jgi:hypothetical protein
MWQRMSGGRKTTVVALSAVLFVILFSSFANYSGINFVGLPKSSNANSQGLSLDGHAYFATTSVSRSKSVSLTTFLTSDLIIVFAAAGNSNSSYSQVKSVNSSGLTFTLRKQYQVISTSGWHWDLEEWYAVSNGPLSGAQITVNWLTTPTSYIVIDAFGVSGANTTSPFDPNSGVPATASGGFASLSTSNANDMVYGLEVTDNTSTPIVGSGFSVIDTPNSSYFGSEYLITNATQASRPVNFTNSNGGVADVEAELADAVTASTGPFYPMTIITATATGNSVTATVYSTQNLRYDFDVWVFFTNHTTDDTGELRFATVANIAIISGHPQNQVVAFTQIPNGTYIFKVQCLTNPTPNSSLSAGYTWTQSVVSYPTTTTTSSTSFTSSSITNVTTTTITLTTNITATFTTTITTSFNNTSPTSTTTLSTVPPTSSTTQSSSTTRSSTSSSVVSSSSGNGQSMVETAIAAGIVLVVAISSVFIFLRRKAK